MTTERRIFPIATAMREALAGGYSLQTFRADATAALIVSLIAMPLAMALSIAVGLPPQHGIYTAIVAGILTPLLGGSIMQVSGPTAAFVVIIAPIVVQHGLRGLIIAEIMAGIMLIGLAAARLGKIIRWVPYPVTIGFTAGIAVVLATLSLNDLLGLGVEKLQGSFTEKSLLLMAHMPQMRWQEALIGVVSVVLMVFARDNRFKIPSVIIGVVAGTLLGLLFSHFGMAVATIGNRFSYDTPLGLAHGIPPFAPHFSAAGLWPSSEELRALFPSAVIIAALAALESLLSATVADSLSHSKHDPNAELAAIGIANIASGFASGIPATGAIARTATNIKSGARTPLASVMHALFILLYVLLLAPLINYLPMASLAALLLVTAYNMSHHRQFTGIIKAASRTEIAVLLVCFGFTVFIDMVAGVTAGMVLALLIGSKAKAA